MSPIQDKEGSQPSNSTFLKEENNAEIIAKIPPKTNGKIHFSLSSIFCLMKCVDINASNIKKVAKTGADKIKKTPI